MGSFNKIISLDWKNYCLQDHSEHSLYPIYGGTRYNFATSVIFSAIHNYLKDPKNLQRSKYLLIDDVINIRLVPIITEIYTTL